MKPSLLKQIKKGSLHGIFYPQTLVNLIEFSICQQQILKQLPTIIKQGDI